MMTKKEIVSELADRADLSRRAAETCLDALTELVYREAETGFTLPGLCRFKVAQRKETRRYNVVTGQHYTVAAHKVLKVVPLKVARNAVAPVPDDLLVTDTPDIEADEVGLVEEMVDGKPVHDPDMELPPTYLPHIAAVAATTEPPAAPVNAPPSTTTESHDDTMDSVAEPEPFQEPTSPTPTSAAVGDARPAAHASERTPDQPPPIDETAAASPPPRVETPGDTDTGSPAEDEETFDFPCPHCGETISARPQDGGAEGICPECRGEFRIPDISPITEEINMKDDNALQAQPDTDEEASGFVTFFCNECGQQIEAPHEMVGLQADCPACGSRLQVPQKGSTFEESGLEEIQSDDKKPDDPSMTVRMDLSDFLS